MKIDLQLAKTFSDGKAYLVSYIAHLRSMYDMRHFSFCDDKVDEFQMQYCRRMHGFLILIPYAIDMPEPSIFLTWSFAENRLAWDASASGLGQSYMEIRENIQDIFTRFLPRVDMLTATPIASIENRFVRADEVVTHWGLVYACAASNIRSFHEDNPDLRGLFIPIKDVPRIFLSKSWNKEVIHYACSRIPELLDGARTVEREIMEQRNFGSRYTTHRKLVKPLLNACDRPLSLLMNRTPRHDLKNLILACIPNGCERLIDVSAGDHVATIEFSRKAKTVILNDIAWDTLEVLASRVSSNPQIAGDIIFTNEDITRAPFTKGAFDVVYCRNTLHHFSRIEELQSVLARLAKWSNNRVIIAEVLDPRDGMTTWDWLRDQYYRRFLGDVGDALLPRSQFQTLMASTFHQEEWTHNVTFHKTIGGVIALCLAERVANTK